MPAQRSAAQRSRQAGRQAVSHEAIGCQLPRAPLVLCCRCAAGARTNKRAHAPASARTHAAAAAATAGRQPAVSCPPLSLPHLMSAERCSASSIGCGSMFLPLSSTRVSLARPGTAAAHRVREAECVRGCMPAGSWQQQARGGGWPQRGLAVGVCKRAAGNSRLVATCGLTGRCLTRQHDMTGHGAARHASRRAPAQVAWQAAAV